MPYDQKLIEIVQLPTRYSLDTSIFKKNPFLFLFLFLYFLYFIFIYFHFYTLLYFHFQNIQGPQYKCQRWGSLPPKQSFCLIWSIHVTTYPCNCIISSCVFPLAILPIDGDPFNVYWYALWICPFCKEHDLCQAYFQENTCFTIKLTNHYFTLNTFTYPCVVVKWYNYFTDVLLAS